MASREHVFDCGIYAKQTLPVQRRRLADGTVVVTKRPRTAANPWGTDRCVTYLDSHGHIKDLPMTNGAGLVDADHNGYQAQKARALGWFPYGECPIALEGAGALRRGFLCEKNQETRQPCRRGTYNAENPCVHAVAEMESRREKHNAEDAKRRAMYQSEADQMIVKSHERQAELLEKQSEVMGKAVEALTATIKKGK